MRFRPTIYIDPDRIIRLVAYPMRELTYVKYLPAKCVVKEPSFWQRVRGMKAFKYTVTEGMNDYGTVVRKHADETWEDLLERRGYSTSVQLIADPSPRFVYKPCLEIHLESKQVQHLDFNTVEELHDFIENTFDLTKLTLIQK